MRLKPATACAVLAICLTSVLTPSTAQAAPSSHPAENSPAICAAPAGTKGPGYSATGYCNGGNVSAPPSIEHLNRQAGGAKAALATWPTPTGEVSVNGTIAVGAGEVRDGGMRRYCCIGDGSQEETQDPMFRLAAGATLQNVIIGGPAGDGVHCAGPCTLRNVWWEDVGEDAATFRGTGNPSFLVDGGGARSATDKIFQHNGSGTLTIQKFQAANFGTFYQSCGNCNPQHQRKVIIRDVALTSPGNRVAVINVNYDDVARFSGVTIINDTSRRIDVCRKYIGNDDGEGSSYVGSGADGVNCIYSSSDITYR